MFGSCLVADSESESEETALVIWMNWSIDSIDVIDWILSWLSINFDDDNDYDDT